MRQGCVEGSAPDDSVRGTDVRSPRDGNEGAGSGEQEREWRPDREGSRETDRLIRSGETLLLSLASCGHRATTPFRPSPSFWPRIHIHPNRSRLMRQAPFGLAGDFSLGLWGSPLPPFAFPPPRMRAHERTFDHQHNLPEGSVSLDPTEKRD